MRAPILGFLIALSSVSAIAQHPVSLTLKPPSQQTEGFLSTWTLTVTNRSHANIENLRLYISSNPAPVVEVTGDLCRLENGASCDFRLNAMTSRDIVFVTRNLASTGHYGVVAEAPGLSAVTYDEAVFGREFLVTSNADSGPGSLRQAILDMNRECDSQTPCIATFRIDSTATTIALLSPLPEITAPDVFIDGGAQLRHTAAVVVLDGRAAGEGNGLTFRSGRARATDLIISGFTGNGIENRGSFAMFMRNRLANNTLRGVQFNEGNGYVTDSVLRDNGRAGGFFWTSSDVRVLRNEITGNGASGLFFHKPASSFRFSESTT